MEHGAGVHAPHDRAWRGWIDHPHLIDRSANPGGVFVFNSASYSISRIITGQLDAYVDIGNRLLKDHPGMRADFERVGNGHVLHLFPYDIGANPRGRIDAAKLAGFCFERIALGEMGRCLLGGRPQSTVTRSTSVGSVRAAQRQGRASQV